MKLPQRRASALLAVLPIVVSCNDRSTVTITGVERPPDVSAMVTPAVAERLSTGSVIEVSRIESHATDSIITPAKAGELALAYMRQFGPYMRTAFEGQRGTAIDFGKLVAGTRVILSETPYRALPDGVPGPFRKHFGSYYMVDLTLPGVGTVMTEAVSVHASDIQMGPNGLRPTGPYGNEFRTWVRPKASHGEPRFTPEEAIALAFHTFGQRIVDVPHFIRVGADYFPHVGRWQLKLERSVGLSIQSTGAQVTSDVVYLDNEGTFQVASTPTATFYLRRSAMAPRSRDLAVDVRDGYTTSFATVVPQRR